MNRKYKENLKKSSFVFKLNYMLFLFYIESKCLN